MASDLAASESHGSGSAMGSMSPLERKEAGNQLFKVGLEGRGQSQHVPFSQLFCRGHGPNLMTSPLTKHIWDGDTLEGSRDMLVIPTPPTSGFMMFYGTFLLGSNHR